MRDMLFEDTKVGEIKQEEFLNKNQEGDTYDKYIEKRISGLDELIKTNDVLEQDTGTFKYHGSKIPTCVTIDVETGEITEFEKS
jgi:hypothetical protein